MRGALPNVTAPSIFGSILPSGPIPATSTIQTTGLRTDPITGAVSQVPADLGRLYVAGAPQAPVLTVTQVQSNGGGLAGQIIVGGNLVSQVVSNGATTGTITVQPVAWEPGAGNLGVAFTPSSSHGTATNFGGFISNGPLSGPVVSVAASSGTTNVTGLEQGGIITVDGSVIGNIVVNGSMNGPVISDVSSRPPLPVEPRRMVRRLERPSPRPGRAERLPPAERPETSSTWTALGRAVPSPPTVLSSAISRSPAR